MKRAAWSCLVLALAAGPAYAGGPTLADCDAALADDPDESKRWGCYYDAARAGADWDAAEQRLRAAMDHHPDEPAHGYALFVLANLVAPKQPDEAIELYRQALEIFAARGDELPRVLTALNLAQRCRVTGQPECAAAALVDAEQAAERHGDPRWVETVKSERVRHLLRTGGDLNEALRLLGETEPLLFPDGDYQARVNWLNSAGMVNAALGRTAQSEALSERLIAAAQAHDDAFVEANARHNRALRRLSRMATAKHGETDLEILAELAQIETLARTGQNLAVELSAMCVRASLEHDEDRLRDCLGRAREFGDGRITSEALIDLASLIAEDRPPTSEREAELFAAIDEAEALDRESEDAWQLIRVLDRRAELRWWIGPEPLARADGEAVLAQIEQVRARHLDPEGRAAMQGSWTDTYERLIGHLLGGSRIAGEAVPPSAEDLAAAFAVSERMRAQVLLEALAEAGADRSIARDEPEYRELLAKISAAQVRLSDPELELADRRQLLAELEALERRELSLLAAKTTELGSPATVSLAEAQAALEPDEALLVYQLADGGEGPTDWDGGAWVMVVTRERMTAHRLADERELLPKLEMFGPLLARRDGLEAEAGARLWSALLADALAELPESVERLIIVPDGALHRLPFAALRPFGDAPTLAESYAITFTPSASSLTHWRRARPDRPPPAKVLALADPRVQAQPARLYASMLGPSERGASLIEGLRLAPLPRARVEAELASKRGGELWLGAEAGEAALRSRDLDDFAVLHFATHALVDELRPGRSAIVLARDAADQDGFLQPREIVELELDGKLVVLSACSSASGAVIDGEGVMGLAHALFQAGAHTVVGSLWPIRDDDALALFERFYVHLDEGQSVAEALSAAQRDRMHAGAPAAAWAGVVVLGDGSLTIRQDEAEREPPAEHERWPAIALAFVALVAALFVGRFWAR